MPPSSLVHVVVVVVAAAAAAVAAVVVVVVRETIMSMAAHIWLTTTAPLEQCRKPHRHVR